MKAPRRKSEASAHPRAQKTKNHPGKKGQAPHSRGKNLTEKLSGKPLALVLGGLVALVALGLGVFFVPRFFTVKVLVLGSEVLGGRDLAALFAESGVGSDPGSRDVPLPAYELTVLDPSRDFAQEAFRKGFGGPDLILGFENLSWGVEGDNLESLPSSLYQGLPLALAAKRLDAIRGKALPLVYDPLGILWNGALAGRMLGLPLASLSVDDLEKRFAANPDRTLVPLALAGADDGVLLSLLGSFAEAELGTSFQESFYRAVAEGWEALGISEEGRLLEGGVLTSALERLLRWSKAGFFQANWMNYGVQDSQSFLLDGRACGAWTGLSAKTSLSPTLASNFVFFPLSAPARRSDYALAARILSAAVPSGAVNKGGAFAMLEALRSVRGERSLAEALHFVVARSDLPVPDLDTRDASRRMSSASLVMSAGVRDEKLGALAEAVRSLARRGF